MAMFAELSGRPIPEPTQQIMHTETKVVSSGPDLETLKTMFASKYPPDNTIKRIEALE